MTSRPSVPKTTALVVGTVIIAILGVGGMVWVSSQPGTTTTPNSVKQNSRADITCVTTTNGSEHIVNCGTPSLTTQMGTNTICSITGQPGGAFLRILPDPTSLPVTKAIVQATHNPEGCTLNGVEYVNPKTIRTFMSNGTEWTPLDTTDGGNYSFSVDYSGQSYNFTANLRPVSLTCATLYLPSGRTNITISAFMLKSTCD